MEHNYIIDVFIIIIVEYFISADTRSEKKKKHQ